MTGATIHTRRGMGAEDCTCDGPWPCPRAGYLTDLGVQRLRARLDVMGGSVSMCECGCAASTSDRSQEPSHKQGGVS